MRLAALCLATAVLATSCRGGGVDASDVIASVQLDDAHDVIVVRTDEPDMTPSLRVCRVPHGERAAVHDNSCASVDPWRWSRTSIAASLDPGPEASLLVVVHAQAQFDLARSTGLEKSQSVDLHLPAEPIATLAPLPLQIVLAGSSLSVDNTVGCLTTGLAGGTNPVFITATAGGAGVSPAPPPDLETACL